MKKLLFSLLFGVGLAGLSGLVKAGDWGPESNIVGTGLNYQSFTSSGFLGNTVNGGNPFTGSTIYKIAMSTGVDSIPEWVQIFNIAYSSPAGGYAYASLNASTQVVTPPYVFRSSAPTGSPSSFVADFSPFGVRTATGTYVYLNLNNVGSRTVTIYYTK